MSNVSANSQLNKDKDNDKDKPKEKCWHSKEKEDFSRTMAQQHDVFLAGKTQLNKS